MIATAKTQKNLLSKNLIEENLLRNIFLPRPNATGEVFII